MNKGEYLIQLGSIAERHSEACVHHMRHTYAILFDR